MPRTSTGLLVLVVAAALAGVVWLLWPGTPESGFRPAQATVIQPAECGSATRTQDVVRVDLDGESVIAVLNGCGHRQGEVLDVEVLTGPAGGTPTVRLAGTGITEDVTTAGRLAAVLAAVAGAGGAVLAWRLRSVAR